MNTRSGFSLFLSNFCRIPFCSRALVLAALLQAGCLFIGGQRFSDFSTATPLDRGDVVVLGFLGGRESWDSSRSGVRRLALKLRQRNLSQVHVETVENTKRDLALRLIREALDWNDNRTLEPAEKGDARIILYGQSFGGAAVIKLSRMLQQEGIPVILTVQIDSVGRGDAVIPSNVRFAANLYQDDGVIISGESMIRAEDPEKTTILGNFRFDYDDKDIDLSDVPWYKLLFRVAHTRMNYDPEVWSKVESLILEHLPAEGR